MAQKPLVQIGTILDMGGHKMLVTAITGDSVIVQHQGSEITIGHVAVEKAVEEAAAI